MQPQNINTNKTMVRQADYTCLQKASQITTHTGKRSSVNKV